MTEIDKESSNFYAKKIWMDKELVNWNDANIHVLSHVIHYGSGVFEGIRLYNLGEKGSGIFRLKEHVIRLLNSAKIYYMENDYSVKELEEIIVKTLKANELKEAYIRPLLYRSYGSLSLNPKECPVKLVVAAWKWNNFLGEENKVKGIKVGTSSWNRLAPNTMPTMAKACGNYLSSQLITLEAKRNGFDEGIALDVNGLVSEGSGENIFLVRDKILYTSSSHSSILDGITRKTVMEIAKELNIEVIEKTLSREWLYLADEVFFSGTAVEIMPVKEIDGITIGNGSRGEITKKIQSYFINTIEGKKEDKFNWLTMI